MLQPSPAQPFPALVPKVALSHAILTMLNSTRLASPSEGRPPEASLAVTGMPRSGAAADAASADPGTRAALPGPALDIAIDDWDALFRAVEDRLRLTVGEPLANMPNKPDAPAHDAAAEVRTIVLECVAALEQLHTALTHERGRREQLERGLHDAQATLARALEKSATGDTGAAGSLFSCDAVAVTFRLSL